MRFLPPMVLHGAHRVSPAELDEHAQTLAQRLGSYPAWPELEDLESCVACVVPPSARPQEPVADTATLAQREAA
jgi:glutathione-regulated potassium-efflux system ancillary protein KefF